LRREKLGLNRSTPDLRLAFLWDGLAPPGVVYGDNAAVFTFTSDPISCGCSLQGQSTLNSISHDSQSEIYLDLEAVYPDHQ